MIFERRIDSAGRQETFILRHAGDDEYSLITEYNDLEENAYSQVWQIMSTDEVVQLTRNLMNHLHDRGIQID